MPKISGKDLGPAWDELMKRTMSVNAIDAAKRSGGALVSSVNELRNDPSSETMMSATRALANFWAHFDRQQQLPTPVQEQAVTTKKKG